MSAPAYNKTRRVERGLRSLLDIWNNATRPDVPRTEHEHKRQAQRARAANRALQARGFMYGIDWHELSDGSRIATQIRERKQA